MKKLVSIFCIFLSVVSPFGVRLANALLLIITSPAWASPSFSGTPWAFTENYGPNTAGFSVGHTLHVGAVVNDTLGVPENILSAFADNPDPSQPDYMLPIQNIGPIFPIGLYEVVTAYTGQMGQWTVTVVNNQGETVTANTNVLDNVRVIPLATNLQVTGPTLAPTITWDPVFFDRDNDSSTPDVEVELYRVRLLNNVNDQFFRSDRITDNKFIVPHGLIVPGLTTIRLEAQHIDDDGAQENRSSTFVRFVAAKPFSVELIRPCYQAKDFLTLEFPARALAFDEDGMLFSVDANEELDNVVNRSMVTVFSAETGAVYVHYETTARGVSGLEFDEDGNLYVSEFDDGSDSGLIRVIDSAGVTIRIIELPDFRPTGVSVDKDGSIYFPGRRFSQPTFGNIYVVDSSGEPKIVVEGLVGTGIAVEDDDNIFVSTSSSQSDPTIRGQAIYRIELDDDEVRLFIFATFDTRDTDELTFDDEGRLYTLPAVFSPPNRRPTTPILQLFEICDDDCDTDNDDDDDKNDD